MTYFIAPLATALFLVAVSTAVLVRRDRRQMAHQWSRSAGAAEERPQPDTYRLSTSASRRSRRAASR